MKKLSVLLGSTPKGFELKSEVDDSFNGVLSSLIKSIYDKSVDLRIRGLNRINDSMYFSRDVCEKVDTELCNAFASIYSDLSERVYPLDWKEKKIPSRLKEFAEWRKDSDKDLEKAEAQYKKAIEFFKDACSKIGVTPEDDCLEDLENVMIRIRNNKFALDALLDKCELTANLILDLFDGKDSDLIDRIYGKNDVDKNE